MIDMKTLITWLGPEGARSGLRDSDIPLKDLIDLARSRGLPLAPKPTRDEVANELAYEDIRKVDKSIEDLPQMSQKALTEYFEKKKPTIGELLTILSHLGIRAGSEDRKHLARFAAREISEIGMYQRVAHGPAATGLRKS